MADPISDLAGVSAWLGTLAVGQTVSVDASRFSAPMVTGLFALLPGSAPLAITVTAVDAGAARLEGTGTILEEDGTTAALVWSQPDGTLTVTLTLTLPTTTAWQFVSGLAVDFVSIKATFAPNLDAGTFGLMIDASIQAGTMTPIPVQVAAPSLAGPWTLTAGTIEVTGFDGSSLTALGGGVDPTKSLPGFDLGDLSLTGVEMVFDPIADTLASIGLGIAYDQPWKFFGDRFVVEGIEIDLQIQQPLTAPSPRATVTATMALPAIDLTFDVGAVFPDQAVFASLAPGSQLDLTAVLAALGAQLPAGFPTISLDALGFTFFVLAERVGFQIGITTPFAIIGSVQLLSFHFNLQADFGSTPATASGALTTVLQLGQSTTLSLGGSYDAGGLSLTGALQQVDLTTVLDDLAASFGFQAPGGLDQLELDTLGVTLTTGTASRFDLTLVGSAQIAGASAQLTATIGLAFGGAAWTGTAAGTLAIQTAAGSSLAFGVAFSDTATDARITATYQGTPFALTELIAALGLGAQPAIPSDLDLSLAAASFTYDFTSGDFTLSAQTGGGSTLTLSSAVSAGVRAYTATLATGQAFSLSNLPLVGAALAKIETITVEDLVVVITSAPAIAVQATVDFGDQRLPLAIALGGTSAATALAAPAGGGGVTSSTSADGTTWYTVQRSFGPVTIGRIGARFQSDAQVLWFAIDASFALGPLTLGLTGLGIGAPLTSFAPQFTLAGLTVAYTSGPLTLAGSLVNLEPPGATALAFAGGLTVGAGSFDVTAFGYYGDGAGFPSMFVFGDLAADLGGPPAFFITGVALGLGYNSALRTPTLEQVASFPLLAALPGSFAPSTAIGPSTPPLAALQTLLAAPAGGGAPWVAPAQGSLWLAAGLTFTSFSLITSQAMVVAELGDELVIDLLGLSRAQFPQLGDGTTLYAFVELELLAQLDPADGVFSIQAVLAPASFLLDRACVLTGGFAFFVWFGPSPHAGDFVLTLGGYNRGFTPPSYYPAVPPVGFHWSIDTSITITGSAYLAITPAVFMAGGSLSATYQSASGATRAWFDAHVDVVLRWKPFWVEASLGITIGASHRVNLLVTSATITVELGCDLDVWGPPTGGTVLVDWYVVKFTISFGAPRPTTPAITGWPDVEAMLPSASASAPLPLTLTATAGLSNPATAPPAGEALADAPAPWIARGSQLAFATTSAIPASQITVGTTTTAGDSFAVFPLGWTGVTATHTVTIEDALGNDRSGAFTIATTTAAVPASLWGAPATDASGRPLVPSGAAQLVPGQLVGITATVLAPAVGASAGPMTVAAQLAPADLGLTGAVLPLSPSAGPVGDQPVASPTALAVIADGQAGIASATAIGARKTLLAALAGAGYAPITRDDPMTPFSDELGCAFAAPPLLVLAS